LQDNLHTARKVLWYIPQFHELYYSGRHRFSPQGILDLLLPAVEAGRLCVLGEVPPAALGKLLQERPRMRLAFKELRVEPLRAAAARLAAQEGGTMTMRREDLLVTLSQLTGLPRSVLDEREGLHPADLAAFFQQRVMGQPEAVSCLVDRVALLKAGLTDPNR